MQQRRIRRLVFAAIAATGIALTLAAPLAAASSVALVAYTVACARGVNLIGGHYSASIIVPKWLRFGDAVPLRRFGGGRE